MSHNDGYRQNTNIENLGEMTRLPICAENVSKQFVKIKTQPENKTDESPRENENEEQKELEVPYVFKLVLRILAIFLVFGTKLSGTVLYCFIAILIVL